MCAAHDILPVGSPWFAILQVRFRICREDSAPTSRRFHTDDPHGNRLEFIAARPGRRNPQFPVKTG
jgi:hypothetical protein